MLDCRRRENGTYHKQIEYKVSSDYRIGRIRIVYCFIERDKAIKAMLEPVGWSPEINHISGHCIINKFTMIWAVLYIWDTI